MPMQSIPMADESYAVNEGATDIKASTKRLVNLYAQQMPQDARSPFIVRSTPGLDLAYTVGAGPIITVNGDISGHFYVLSGAEFYRLQGSPPTPVHLGTVGTFNPDFGYPSIAVGDLSACIVVTPNAWVCDHNGALQQITDPNFPGASSVSYLDGYFIFTEPNNGFGVSGAQIFVSDLLSGTSFNALNFAYASGGPNVINKVVVHNKDIWLLGETGIEAWYDAGTPNFPLAAREGSAIRYGYVMNTVAHCDNALFFMVWERAIFRLDGYTLTKISSPAVEEWIRLYFFQADALAYMQLGRWFYAITFKNNTGATIRTFVYDCITQKWHERDSNVSGTHGHRIMSSDLNVSDLLAGDRYNGNLYRFNNNTPNENGGPGLVRQMTLPVLWAKNKRAFMSRLELEAVTSFGPATGVTLEYSDDNGDTFKTSSAAVTTGGSAVWRLIWNRLGSFRQRVLRFTTTGLATFYGVDADIEEGQW